MVVFRIKWIVRPDVRSEYRHRAGKAGNSNPVWPVEHTEQTENPGGRGSVAFPFPGGYAVAADRAAQLPATEPGPSFGNDNAVGIPVQRM